MGPLTVIIGSVVTKDKQKGVIRLVTPRGDVISIKESDIVSGSSIDAGGDLKRFAIGSDAVVTVEFSGHALRGFDFVSDTITKYQDDGGTISKSRDDT